MSKVVVRTHDTLALIVRQWERVKSKYTILVVFMRLCFAFTITKVKFGTIFFLVVCAFQPSHSYGQDPSYLKFKKTITVSSAHRFIRFYENETKSFLYDGVKQTDILSPSWNVFELGFEISSNRENKLLNFVTGIKGEIYRYKYLHMALNPNIYYGHNLWDGPYDYLDSILVQNQLFSFTIPFLLDFKPLNFERFRIMSGFSLDLYYYVTSKIIEHKAYEYFDHELNGEVGNLQTYYEDFSHKLMRANLSYIFKPRISLTKANVFPVAISPFFKFTLRQQFGHAGQGNDNYVSGLHFLQHLKYNLITFGIEFIFF